MGNLTPTKLNSHLWAAADILRGSIDSSDYKNYIFGFLFLKRLSDRFEEEAETLIANGEEEDVAWTDPDEHQFFVPKRARWKELAKLTSPVYPAIVDELRGDIAIARGQRDEARKQYDRALGRLDEAAPTRPLLELKLIDAGGQPPAKPET